MEKDPKDMTARYPKTKDFEVLGSVPVPHGYTIGTRHVQHANEHFGGRLGDDAIKSAEEAGIKCEVCRKSPKPISFEEHKQVLIIGITEAGVESYKEDKESFKPSKALRDYLHSIRKQAETEGFIGFSFRKNTR